MRAMLFEQPGTLLRPVELAIPTPQVDQLVIKVHTCGVCRTDLHVVDGELTEPNLPLIPGHQIVGTVIGQGDAVKEVKIGERIGVPWLGHTCGTCRYCRSQAENLCDDARFTGYQLNGGFADFAVADQRYCFPIPDQYSHSEAAPLLCAGLIGYRALRMAGDARRLGLYGFGAAAHIVAQIAHYEKHEVYAFTRPGDAEAQSFALGLGAVWAGDSDTTPPVPLDAAILFAPVGGLVPAALRSVTKGGTVVCAGIHMSQIPAFDYELLWGERIVRSVANLTRQDGLEFFSLAPRIPVRTEVQVFPLEQANEALDNLREGRIQGAAVLEINP